MASTMLIGSRIRRLRKQRNFTLAQMASKAGISAGALSKIENDLVSPTVANLMRLAEGMGIGLGELIVPGEQNAPPTGRIAVSRSADLQFTPTKGYEMASVCADLRIKRMQPIRKKVYLVEPGTGDGMITHDGEEFVYVISGRIEVHTELYAPISLEAGDSVYLDSGMGHAYECVDPTPAEILVVWCGDPGGSEGPIPSDHNA